MWFAFQAAEFKYGRYYGMPLTSVFARNEAEEKAIKNVPSILHDAEHLGKSCLELGKHYILEWNFSPNIWFGASKTLLYQEFETRSPIPL
jgi:hypothetical protein